MQEFTLTISADTYHRLEQEAMNRDMTVDQFLDTLAQQFPPLPGPFDGEDFERAMGMEATIADIDV